MASRSAATWSSGRSAAWTTPRSATPGTVATVRSALQRAEVVPEALDGHLPLQARDFLLDVALDRLREVEFAPRDLLQALVHRSHQPLTRHAAAPRLLWIQVDEVLEVARRLPV